MQVSTWPIIIDDRDKMQIFARVISDQFSLKIITSIINNPKTAVEIAKTTAIPISVIAKETNIPISTVYRRLQFLQENKLLKVSGDINKDGKFFLYQSKIKEIKITFNGESMKVSIIPNLNFTVK